MEAAPASAVGATHPALDAIGRVRHTALVNA